MDEVVTFDGTEVSTRAPGLYEIRYIGEISATTMQGLIEHLRKESVGKEYVLVLGDQSRAGGMTADARKLATQATDIPLRGIAFYGGSFNNTVASKLVLGAFRVVARLPFEVHFASSRDEALAWLDDLRRTIESAPR